MTLRRGARSEAQGPPGAAATPEEAITHPVNRALELIVSTWP